VQPQIPFGALIRVSMITFVFIMILLWIDDHQLGWSLGGIIGFILAIGASCIVIALLLWPFRQGLTPTSHAA
jgi:hypothetical protein